MYSGRQTKTAGGLIGIALSRLLLLLFFLGLRVADSRGAALRHAFLLQAFVGLGVLDRRALPLSGHSEPPLLTITVTFAPIMPIKPRPGQQQSTQKARGWWAGSGDAAAKRQDAAMMTRTQKPSTT